MKTIHILTSASLCLTLLLSACNNTPLQSSTTKPSANPLPQPLQSVSTNLDGSIAPLPKGPRQPVVSASPQLALARQDFSPRFPVTSGSSNFGPGTAGHGEYIIGPTPFPVATSDISVVEKSSFRGEIYNTSNQPVSGATVTVRSLNSSVPYSATTTSTAGSYAFNNAPAGVQVEIIVTLPGQPSQRRVEVLRSNKDGDPNANRYDFGTNGSSSNFGSDTQAIGQPSNTPTPSPTPVPTPSPTPMPTPQAGMLTAGSWRDLDHWDYWLNLMQKDSWSQMMTYWGISPIHRLSVKLKQTAQSDQNTQNAQPVIDQALVLKDADNRLIARAHSDNQGQAEFFAGLFATQPGPFKIETEDGSVSLPNLYPQAQPRDLMLTQTSPAPVNVDLMLMMDTTGSMGDELEYLKVELHNVFNRVQQDQPQLKLRASMNFYRDAGDEYVVRDFAFTSDLALSRQQILAQSADGGGDTPEAVTEALENGLKQHDWSTSARTRLLFLVLDAPPHDDQAQLTKLRELIPVAQQLGVRIIPVASSGIDKSSEFMLRMLAITTGGEYVFLTDDSGIGGSHIEPTIGDHKVEKLNALLLNLVGKYSKS